MKNFIRLQAYKEYGYDKICIQIWRQNKRYGQFNFDRIGEVVFTKFNSKYDSFKVIYDGESYEHLLELGKMLKYVRENSQWDCDIHEFIKIIEGEEIVQFSGEMIPVKENGNFFFACYLSSFNSDTGHTEKENSIYTHIIAPNEYIAQKLAKKFYPKIDFVIEKGKQIDVKPFNFELI